MSRLLLVPPLPLEHMAALDKYAHRLYDWLESSAQGFEVRLAASIGELTKAEPAPGRTSGGFKRWWTQEVDPSALVMPGPLYGPHRWLARYMLYPRRVARECRRADVVHILDHSYAHITSQSRRRPVAVTVHDLMPVIVLRSPEGGWRERIRKRLYRNDNVG